MSRQSFINELTTITMLRELVNAYEEISANNMRKIRNTVVLKRDFLSEITLIYNEVRNTYKHDIMRLRKHKKVTEQMLSLLQKNTKTAYVFLSTNANLYGSIVRDTFVLLQEYLSRENAEVVIVGKAGKLLFESGYPSKKYTYFDFPDDVAESEIFKSIVLHIVQYERVIVFHSKFDTIVSQKPVAVTISGDEKATEGTGKEIRYLFEPSLETIIAFFEKEIFAAIFEQIIHESDLSKFASRMTLLDKTLQNIQLTTKKLQQQQRILKHQAFNKSQQNVFSSMSLWKRKG